MNRRLALLFIFTGLALCYWVGYRELRLGRASSGVPESMTLKQLIHRGVEGNPYVEVYDFRLLTAPEEYVVVVDPARRLWEVVYVPIPSLMAACLRASLKAAFSLSPSSGCSEGLPTSVFSTHSPSTLTDSVQTTLPPLTTW